jgi:hypothetical protein
MIFNAISSLPWQPEKGKPFHLPGCQAADGGRKNKTVSSGFLAVNFRGSASGGKMMTELWALAASDLAALAGGLPQGVQIIGPRFREDLCLDAAAAIEERTEPLTPVDPRPQPG